MIFQCFKSNFGNFNEDFMQTFNWILNDKISDFKIPFQRMVTEWPIFGQKWHGLLLGTAAKTIWSDARRQNNQDWLGDGSWSAVGIWKCLMRFFFNLSVIIHYMLRVFQGFLCTSFFKMSEDCDVGLQHVSGSIKIAKVLRLLYFSHNHNLF